MSEDQDLANRATGMYLGGNEPQVAAFYDHIRARIAEAIANERVIRAEAVANERAVNEARIRALQEELERRRISFEATQQAKEDAYRAFWQETTRKHEENRRERLLNDKDRDGKLKIREPPTFAGGIDTLKITGWVDQLNTYFKYVTDTEEKKTEYAAGLLIGHARYWYVQYRQTQGETPPPWEEFQLVLMETFSNPTEGSLRIRQYRTLKQTGTVDELIHTYIKLQRTLPPEVPMAEKIEIDIFTGALKPDIENHVLDKNPATLNEAFQIAANFERYIKENPKARRRNLDQTILGFSCHHHRNNVGPEPTDGITNITLTEIDVDAPEDKMFTAPVRTNGEETRGLLDPGASADFFNKQL
ncbi:hypothetical protein E3Q06_04416 [Wallemia mellicola]|uniref:Ty3 transposon capsid-like protein domain-containing protein n=1 Tax=Wallemia mellicola TaxID=1708541 RepID=A0AB74K7W4_9BASI|nr:hypothetical protein E3Q24_04426 [Wallemia mellicola]TIB77963.1 hypothetical protein E3Q21_04422 [Wallemia mellicola]TIB82273.1 hypothetical protein E3Q20_04435 [Wallemia mellicola]TIC18616.1 hypothetical protein E3Q12_04423 [Wallemia mellicola]TIC29844.1 hypothetical protein E3Q09_04385 [Wallemia mellicola]